MAKQTYADWKAERDKLLQKGQDFWTELLKETATNIAALNELKPKDIEGTYRLSIGLHNVDMETGKPKKEKAKAAA